MTAFPESNRFPAETAAGAATLEGRLPSQFSCRLSTWTSVAMGIVIFVAGGVCGAAAMRMTSAAKPLTSLSEVPQRVAAKMQRDLGLSDQQRDGIERIVREHQPELHRIRMRIMPEMRHELGQVVDEISVLLTPQQATSFRADAERRLDVHFPPSESAAGDPANAENLKSN